MNNNTTRLNTTTSRPLTTAAAPVVDVFFNNLTTAGQVFVIYCNVVHLVYMLMVAVFPDLRKRPLLFINHAVFADWLFPAGSLVFQYFDPTLSTDKTLVTGVCSFFELYWPFSIFTRLYAILLIAIHRYLAVFRSETFKKINASNLYLSLPILAIWSFSLAISFVFKYAFKTTYSLTFCLHGFSTVWIDSLLNGLFFILFGIIFPGCAIVAIYVAIHYRLSLLGKKLQSNAVNEFAKKPSQAQIITPRSSSSNGSNRINKQREMRFANQFILLCATVVLTVCGNSIFGLRGVIPNYFNLFYYWRPVIRCHIMFFSAFVPILSFYFNPLRKKMFRRIHEVATNTQSSAQKNNNSSVGDSKSKNTAGTDRSINSQRKEG